MSSSAPPRPCRPLVIASVAAAVTLALLGGPRAARADAPFVRVTPGAPTPTVNLGRRPAGCPNDVAFVAVDNPGPEPIQLADARLPTGVFIPVEWPFLPRMIPPNGRTLLPIRLLATSAGTYRSSLAIDVASAQVDVPLYVETLGEVVDDAWVQPNTTQVDMLWVFDDDASMAASRTTLGANFHSFIQFVMAQALRARVVATTISEAQSGRLLPFDAPLDEQILDTETDDADAWYAAVIDGYAPTRPSAPPATGQGIAAAMTARAHLRTRGVEYPAPGRVFSVIIVSNRDDRSPVPVTTWLRQFRDIAGFRNENLLSVNTISGPNDENCRGPGGAATAAPRYVELARQTRGVWTSICTSDWSRGLEDVSTTAFGFRSSFYTSAAPVLDSIAVQVDGTEVPATGQGGTVNWVYSQASQAISFSPFATPEPGARIEIRYRPQCGWFDFAHPVE